MAVIRNLVVKIGADISNLSKGLKTAQQQLDKVSKKMSKVGNILTASFTLPLTTFATLAVKASSDVEESMATISKSFSGTSEEIEKMTKLAQKMSSTTIYGLNEVSQAMNYMKKAGFSVSQMESSLTTLTDLATASQVELEVAVGSVVKVLGQFNLGTEDTCSVANVLAAVVGKTSLTLEELSNALAIVGKTANGVNYSVESMAAAIAMLSDAGFSAEESGAYLKSIIQQLESPTTEMQKVIERLGLTLEDVNPKTNSLVDILKKFAKAGLTSKDATELFGEEVDSAFMALLSQGIDNLEEFTKTITDTNSAEDEATKQMGTLTNQLKALKNQFNEILVQFGEVLLPLVKDFLNLLSPLLEKLSKINTENIELALKIAGVVAAIGPVIKIISTVIKSISALSSVLSALTSPVGLVIAAIAALIGVLVTLYQTNEEFRENVAIIWNQIKEIVEVVVADLKAFWDKYGQQIMEAVSKVFNTILTVVSSCFNAILMGLQTLFTYVEPIWNQLKALFMSLWDVLCELYELLKPVFDAIASIVVTCWGVCSGVIQGVISALGPFIQAVLNVLQVITDVVGAIVSLFRGDFSGAFDHLKNVGQNFANYFSNIWQGILNLGKGFVDGFINLFSSLGIDIEGILSNVFGKIGNFFSNLWSGVTNTVSNIWNAVTSVFGNLGSWFSNLFSQAFNWGKNLIEMIGNGIKSAVNWVKDACSTVIGKIKGWLGFGSPTEEGPGRTSDEWAPNLMKMYTKGIELGVPDIEEAVGEVAEALTNIDGKALNTTISAGESSIGSDVLNGILAAMSVNKDTQKDTETPIELSIDGTVFARLIYPSLTKEFKRNGMTLKEGGFI